MYSYHNNQGSIVPNISDVTYLGTQGIEENVFVFEYQAIDGLRLVVAIALLYHEDSKTSRVEAKILKKAFRSFLKSVYHTWISFNLQKVD